MTFQGGFLETAPKNPLSLILGGGCTMTASKSHENWVLGAVFRKPPPKVQFSGLLRGDFNNHP